MALVTFGVTSAQSASLSNTKCSKKGATIQSGNVNYLCQSSKGKLIWIVDTSSKKGGKVINEKFVTSKYKLSSKKFGQCSALAPANWSSEAVSPYYAADLFSPNKDSYAGWYLRTVNPYLATSGSDRMNGVPDEFDSADPTTQVIGVAQYVSKKLGYSGTLVDTGKTYQNNGYVAKVLKSSDSQAIVIYKNPPFPGDGVSYSYIAAGRIAIAPLSTNYDDLLIIARYATSIDCKVTLIPTSSPSGFAPSKKSKKAPNPSDENEYNATLGSGYAYDSDGTPYGVSLDMYSSNACGKGIGGVPLHDANGCRVLDWGNMK